MASTHLVPAKYSSHLDSMTETINAFRKRNHLSVSQKNRFYRGIEDFCYNNNREFKEAFYQKLDITSPPKTFVRQETGSLEKYAQFLAQLDGECVFLLRDTFPILKRYQQLTKKGFGLLVGRYYLCPGKYEQDYYKLISLVYTNLRKASSYDQFLDLYYQDFKKIIKKDSHFYTKSQQIYDYIRYRYQQKITWVDYGFQFTFSLFCLASVRYHSRGRIAQDIHSFTAYIWLQNFFSDKIFSERSEVVINLELDAIEAFKDDFEDRASGSLIGFAIGDALGYPAAGVNLPDLKDMIDLPITGYQDSPKHPFFNHLTPGQYTDNTNFVITAAESLIAHQGYKPDHYVREMTAWVEKIIQDPEKERWMGPTALEAFKKMIQGVSYDQAGSKTTGSCSCVYRVIPLGLLYRVFCKKYQKLPDYAAQMAAMTHNSSVSRTGAVVVALLMSDLINGNFPTQSVRSIVKTVKDLKGHSGLLKAIDTASKMIHKSNEEAREYFGTGSPMIQTLPLAIFYFLKYQHSFEEGVLAACHSFRNDSKEEATRVARLTWEQKIREAIGGETNGIAALTGSFLGVHLGVKAIPNRFLIGLEHAHDLQHLSIQLVQCQRR